MWQGQSDRGIVIEVHHFKREASFRLILSLLLTKAYLFISESEVHCFVKYLCYLLKNVHIALFQISKAVPKLKRGSETSAQSCSQNETTIKIKEAREYKPYTSKKKKQFNFQRSTSTKEFLLVFQMLVKRGV